MKIAVISDIHGNIEAFREILKDIDHGEIEFIVNLGDSIGYGPDPQTVLNHIQKSPIVNISGNHEQAILDKVYRQSFVNSARKSIEQTIRYITDDSLSYIKTLPKTQVLNGALFVHGCPPDSSTIYLNQLTHYEIYTAFNSFTQRICFVGHTHRLILLSFDGESVLSIPLKEGLRNLEPHSRYVVNVGSVGQPRDNDLRAAYVIWDSVKNRLKVRRIHYDFKATAIKIIRRGFQKQDADRLSRFG